MQTEQTNKSKRPNYKDRSLISFLKSHGPKIQNDFMIINNRKEPPQISKTEEGLRVLVGRKSFNINSNITILISHTFLEYVWKGHWLEFPLQLVNCIFKML